MIWQTYNRKGDRCGGKVKVTRTESGWRREKERNGKERVILMSNPYKSTGPMKTKRIGNPFLRVKKY